MKFVFVIAIVVAGIGLIGFTSYTYHAFAADGEILATITVGTNPYGVAYDSANGRMYVTNADSDNVSVIRTSDNTVIATITVGTNPSGIAYDSANGRMYVTNNVDSGNISVISTATNTVIDANGAAAGTAISVGDTPTAIAYDSANGRMYVTNNGGSNVSVIDTTTYAVTGQITVGTQPRGIAYDSANGRMYVSNFGSNYVKVIDTVVASTSSSSGGGGSGSGLQTFPKYFVQLKL